MKPRGLRHLALKTRDLRGTERFYTEVLGLSVAFRHRGMVFLESPGGDDVLNFNATRKGFDPEAGGLDHFGLRFDRKEFARVRAEVEAAGVPVVGRRGRWSFYIRDPNGYTVELYAD
jgi:catechol-2,3-dioxygenase